ncbi:interleukin-6 receptor subunit alpha [Hyperolius riggenbachi]|uniref:interleukin-6 receptor subunit alpha n=1 Tax=Hyperolius riggenbachi TaxID=752182 RepID=UPI0035A2C72F
MSYKDEDIYTCYSNSTPLCSLQLVVKDEIEKPEILCYLRFPAHNITCEWTPTKELPPQATVKLISWRIRDTHVISTCTFQRPAGKFSCTLQYEEGDSSPHFLSLCVTGRIDRKMSNALKLSLDDLLQPNPPVNVTVTAVNKQPRRLRVTWSRPEHWLGYFYKLQYEVQYHVEGSPHVSNGTTNKMDFEIPDALEKMRHTVRVRAREKYHTTWSLWSEKASGTPWSDEKEETFMTTVPEDYISTQEDYTEGTVAEATPTAIPRYVWFGAGISLAIVFLLFLGIMLRSREIKLLKLKGDLLRSLFHPSQKVPAAPQPASGQPLLMSQRSSPESVAITVPTPPVGD